MQSPAIAAPFLLPCPLILASGSPRRKQLLAQLGFEFAVKVKEVDEVFPMDMEGPEVPAYLAHKKAAAFNDEEAHDNIILTADTVVLLDKEVLNKPADFMEAHAMLSKLAARKHQVVTGVCIRRGSAFDTFTDTTEVSFGPLKEEDIDYYIKNYQPYDKAGAYGIQEWIGMVAITAMKGSYFNVMGLPVHKVYEGLAKWRIS